MGKGKLIKHEKQIINGVHATWQGPKGLLYKHTVTFDNGDTGTAQSTKAEPTWKLDTEYTYEKSVTGNFTNIKNMKVVENAFSKSTFISHFDKPEVQREITQTKSLELAIKYFTRLDQTDERVNKASLLQLQAKIFMWCYEGIGEDIKGLLHRRSALDLAFQSFDILSLQLTDIKSLFSLAKEYLVLIKS